MNRIYQNMLKGSLWGAVVLLGASACTDDHFDLNAGGTASGTNTIWQNIEANPDLDSVAMVLRRAKVMTSDRDAKATQTYAELLNTSQEFTAWLPKNGHANAKYYLALLDSADALRSTNRLEALKLDYDVSNRYARNHIARFNYQALTGNQEVRLMNGKVCSFKDSIFNGVQIDPSEKVISSNGVLHVLNAVSPFANNVYDFIANSPETSDLFAAIDSFNVNTFLPGSSTEGTMNSNGQMEYVDSVFSRTNELLSSVSAYNISNEDSLYISIVPSNKAYSVARQKIASLFNYANSYNYDWVQNSLGGGSYNKTGNDALKLNVDSLREINISKAVLGGMFVSGSKFSYPLDKSDPTIVQKAETADSLVTTGFFSLYNTNPGGKNPIFGGVEPQKASNGYIYLVDDYNYELSKTLQQRIEISPASYNIAGVTNALTVNSGEYVLLTSENRNPEVKGGVPDNVYYYFEVSGRQQLTIDFKLSNVLSGNYRVSLLMLPNRVNVDKIRYDEDGTEIVEDPVFVARIIDDKGSNLGQKTIQDISQDSVSRVVLWDNFKFPYCYAALPDGYESFPMLRLIVSTSHQNRGNFKALSIAAIVLEPIESDN